MEDQKLRFKDFSGKIQLRPCRRNLLGVHVADLLLKSPPAKVMRPGHDEETIMHVQRSTKHEECDETKTSHHVNVKHQQGSCQPNGVIHGEHAQVMENPTKKDDHESELKQVSLTTSNYLLTAAQLETQTTLPEQIDTNHGPQQALAISDSRTADAGGSGLVGERYAHRREPQTSRDSDTGGMGPGQGSVRKTSGQDVCRDLRSGPMQLLSAEEPAGSLVMGQEPSDVPQSTYGDHQQGAGASASDAHGAGQEEEGIQGARGGVDRSPRISQFEPQQQTRKS